MFLIAPSRLIGTAQGTRQNPYADLSREIAIATRKPRGQEQGECSRMAPVATLCMVSVMPSYTFWAPEGTSSNSVLCLEALVGVTWRERGARRGRSMSEHRACGVGHHLKVQGEAIMACGANPRPFLAEGERRLLTAKAAKQTATKASPL